MGIKVPPSGTHGAGAPAVMNRVLAPLMRLQIARYRRAKGGGQPEMMGFPALILTTVGARSGRPRTVPLGGFPDGDDAWLVVASAGGGRTHPAWFINMAHNPDQIWVEVGPRRLRVVATTLEAGEREAALRRIAAIAPRYAAYQQKTDRQIPVVRLLIAPVA